MYKLHLQISHRINTVGIDPAKNRDVTKFEFDFDDVRILASAGIFDIRWSFSVECRQSQNFPFIAQNSNWCACAQLVLSHSFQMQCNATCFLSWSYIRQIKFTVDSRFHCLLAWELVLVFGIRIRYSTNSIVIIRIRRMRVFFTFVTSIAKKLRRSLRV